jgi:hypothetical protein
MAKTAVFRQFVFSPLSLYAHYHLEVRGSR